MKQRAIEMLDNTGYEEITLSSLSSSDYDELADLVYYLIEECRQRKLNIARHRFVLMRFPWML